MNTRKIVILFIALTALCNTAKSQHEVVVDQVVAVVGKNIIKLSDIENSYIQIRRQQGYANAKENRCQLLEGMLLSKLLVHKGEIDSVEVSDDEVEQQVQYYLKNYIRQYGSKEAMYQATGHTYDDLHDIYFDLLKDKLLSQRVEYNLTEHVKVTPGEVTAYYNQIPKDSLPEMSDEYEFSEIVLNPSITEAERERVRFELAQLRERILKGERFDMLATLYSEDPVSAKKGGELGFFTRGDMVGEFEAAAFALKPGEVSPIIETNYGFHIIQLIERRGNSINARHILLAPKVSSSDMLKARMLLDSIANQIRLGNITFEDAARQFSEGATKQQGGIVANPYTGNNRFSKEVAKELFPSIPLASMKVGDISNATAKKNEENKDVYYILKLTKKIDAHKANLTDDYDKLYNATLEKAKNEKVRAWAQKMIQNTYIRICDDYKDCEFELNWIK
ncbi:MAG: peptidylprolyl isomerase [Bacteroidales bacterium]|nr:peptidylprolyl isomerase [Bacteroidales bacterium]